MGVTVEFDGPLVARTGTRRARTTVDDDTTVAGLVDRLAARHGPQLRPALLEDGQLRSDTDVIVDGRRLSADDIVSPGSTVEVRAGPDGATAPITAETAPTPSPDEADGDGDHGARA